MKNKFYFSRLAGWCVSHSLVSVFLFTTVTTFSQMFGQEPNEPVRTYDVQHIKMDVKLDLEKKTVDGKATTTIVPLSNGFNKFTVDAIGMNVKRIDLQKLTYTSGTKVLKFDYDKKKLTVYLDDNYSITDTIIYSVYYSTTNPEKGLYFIQPSVSLPTKPYQVWSQGEGEDNRYWIPCWDYPNDMQTTEMIVTVDSKYQTISNGMMVEKKSNSDGTSTWQWVLNKPHVSYLIMLGAGQFDIVEDSWEGIPIHSYVPVGKYDWGKRAYVQSADIVKFFSEKIGFKYPWERLGQITVEDFIYGGMENTGAIVYWDGTIYDEFTPPDYNAAGLLAHEIAHQWWGDVITCKNWNHIWLNESFATYFQMLYFEQLYGKDEFDYGVFRNGNNAMFADSVEARKPIVTRDGLGTNTYDKGSVVLNMLRNLLGDEKFWKAMNIYITQNQFTCVTTSQLINAVHSAANPPDEDHIPFDYNWFFDQWVYSAGQPQFSVDYSYDKNSKELKFNTKQVQRLDTSSIFKTIVPVEIITKKSSRTEMLDIQVQSKTFSLTLDDEPLCVIFNKGNKVLSKVWFTKPKEDWLYQLKNSTDAIDRITAIRGLKSFAEENDVVAALKDKAMDDAFWGVKNEAIRMLTNSRDNGVIEFLKTNYSKVNDSRLRRAMLSTMRETVELYKDYPEKESLGKWVEGIIASEKSYYAIADGINLLSKLYYVSVLYDAIVPYLSRDSHAEVIRRNIMDALGPSGDKRSKNIFMEYSQKGYTQRLRNSALNGLEYYLSDADVINFLNNELDKPSRPTKFLILRLLERAGNPSSKPFLESLFNKTNDDELKKRIEEVIAKM